MRLRGAFAVLFSTCSSIHASVLCNINRSVINYRVIFAEERARARAQKTHRSALVVHMNYCKQRDVNLNGQLTRVFHASIDRKQRRSNKKNIGFSYRWASRRGGNRRRWPRPKLRWPYRAAGGVGTFWSRRLPRHGRSRGSRTRRTTGSWFVCLFVMMFVINPQLESHTQHLYTRSKPQLVCIQLRAHTSGSQITTDDDAATADPPPPRSFDKRATPSRACCYTPTSQLISTTADRGSAHNGLRYS